MRALSVGPVERTQVAGVMQRSRATAERLLDDLAGEGLCQIAGTCRTVARVIVSRR